MDLTAAHEQLILTLQLNGIRNENVLNAMRFIPREAFLEKQYQEYAYIDRALPISCNQTISQPYIVARMTEALLNGHDRLGKVLEIGTGSGYQAAILSCLVDEVYSIERIEDLHLIAKERLQNLGISNVHLLHADGTLGWPEHAPFEGIIVTAGTDKIPPALLEQLADGGRLILPIDKEVGQRLEVITREGENFTSVLLDPVMFVPLLKGKA
jgi:protein-L-isoaspartate(D-aspartate) O-methyltransferase